MNKEQITVNNEQFRLRKFKNNDLNCKKAFYEIFVKSHFFYFMTVYEVILVLNYPILRGIYPNTIAGFFPIPVNILINLRILYAR